MTTQTLLGQGVMTEETRSAGELAAGGPVRGWRAAFPPGGLRGRSGSRKTPLPA